MVPTDHRITYRPDVDGLRAVAVVAVVLFHAGLGVPGGYIGVDVFFVISGFLITSLILKELRNRTFSFLNFWERRARRILPALAVVVAAVMVAGWFLLLPEDYRSLARGVIALGFFAANVQFWREDGYFRAASEEKPLLHTWSLSVEEQFYIAIPLVLAALFRFRKSSWIVPVLAAGALISFALAWYGIGRSASATFFLLPTRAWELAAGSLLAFARPLPSARVRSLMAWGGLAAIVLSCFLYTAETRFPGPTAFPPVAGAALLIWSGIGCEIRKGPLPLKLLASGPLVAVGLLSYSLYLWHWPLFAYYHYLFSGGPGVAVSIVFVLLSVLLAWLSLRYVERPFRSRKVISSRKLTFALSGSAMAALLFPAFILWRQGGLPARVPEVVMEIQSATRQTIYLVDMTPEDVPGNLMPLGLPDRPPEVLVWGDSHAMAILPAVDAACRELGITGIGATSSATPPVLEWFFRNRHGLSERAPVFNQAVMDHVRENARNGSLRQVILAARWTAYLNHENYRVGLQEALALTIREIREAGCEVILLKEVPTFPRDVPRSLALHHMVGWDSLIPVLDTELHGENSFIQNVVFDNILAQVADGVHVIDPLPFLVLNGNRIEPVDELGTPLYRDDNHLSLPGSLRLQDAFVGLLDEDRPVVR